MSIWKTPVTLAQMNERGEGLFSDTLGIRFTELGDDYLLAEMPLQKKHKQPLGIMNGGVSCGIAETVGAFGRCLRSALWSGPPRNLAATNHVVRCDDGIDCKRDRG